MSGVAQTAVDPELALTNHGKGALYNQMSAGTCPVKTYMDGGKRWADYRDVAKHLDDCRKLSA